MFITVIKCPAIWVDANYIINLTLQNVHTAKFSTQKIDSGFCDPGARTYLFIKPRFKKALELMEKLCSVTEPQNQDEDPTTYTL